MFQKNNYEVKSTEDDQDSLDIIKQFKPDIIISNLTESFLGEEKTYQTIRNKPEFRNVFVVILSARAAEKKIDFIRLGADACIAKGSTKEMITNIQTVLKHAKNNNTAELSRQIFGSNNVYPIQEKRKLRNATKIAERNLQNKKDGLITLTPGAKIISLNSIASAFFNIPEEKLLATTLFDHFEKEQKDLIIDRYTIITDLFNNITNGTIIIGEHDPIILQGKYVLLKMIPVFDGELQSIIILISDITARKHAEHLEILVA